VNSIRSIEGPANNILTGLPEKHFLHISAIGRSRWSTCFVSQRLDLDITAPPKVLPFTVSATATFRALLGTRLRDVSASVRHSMRIASPTPGSAALRAGIDDPPRGLGGQPLFRTPVRIRWHNCVQSRSGQLASTCQIRDPDGQLFPRDEITLADLRGSCTVLFASRRVVHLSGRQPRVKPQPGLNGPSPILPLAPPRSQPRRASSAAPLVPRTLGLSPLKATSTCSGSATSSANVVGATSCLGPWPVVHPHEIDPGEPNSPAPQPSVCGPDPRYPC